MPNRPVVTQLPPSDVERTEVLARLIRDRIAVLELWRKHPGLSADLERELFVLTQLRDEWLLEGRPQE